MVEHQMALLPSNFLLLTKPTKATSIAFALFFVFYFPVDKTCLACYGYLHSGTIVIKGPTTNKWL